jgi:membrane-associated phospholipid phosphatase
MRNTFLPLLFIILAACGGVLFYATGWDVAAHHWAIANRTPVWDWLNLLGDGVIQVVGCAGMGIFTYLRGQYALSRAWYWAAPLSLLAGLVGQVVKWTLGRPRPKVYPELYDPQWFESAARFHSMPSGHTLTSFAIVAMVAAHYRLGWWVLLGLATLAGLARVFVGAHWMGDVVCGAFLGYALGHMAARLKKLQPQEDTRHP